MFSELIDIFRSLAGDLVPIAKVDQWEGGVIIRCGRFNREIGAGWHWKIPFFETTEITTIVTTTSRLPAQSLTTSDGRGVVVEAAVRYSFSDVKKLLLEVTDRADAINDTAMGVIGKAIRQRTWAECCDTTCDEPLETAIAKRTRTLLRRWGVSLEEITLCTIATMRSIRLIKNEAEA